MNAPHITTDLVDRQHETARAPAMVSGGAINRGQISSIVDGRHVAAPIGTSHAWREVIRRATQVAATEATTCLQGESGTGKEVIARFIHQRSPRWRGPFIAINCAALPEQLLESELFGFERGAFTGAQQSKPGQIELAADGVLFLDEVTEMMPAAQAKFLRVIQEREFVRLGGTRPVRANVRVITATNRDLREAVTLGQFRADLYYRLNVFDIRLPPLRQRREEILPLAQRFLNEFGHHATGAPQLMPDAIAALLRHDWPGNVRELRNVIERATIVCENSAIHAEDLSLLATPVPAGDSTDLEELERRTIERVMRDVNWNKVQASRKLGITRTQLYMRLRKYGLEDPAALAIDACEMANASAAH
jgi:transcriptional regulator with PAS, ATPase and Fis domain